MKYFHIVVLVPVLAVAGCASDSSRGMRETTGTLTGAVLDGLSGTQFGSGSGKVASTAVGVLIGGLIGSEIGRSMDEVDRMQANQAINQAYTAPLGEMITWNNPDNNHTGAIMPVRDGYSATGRYCRSLIRPLQSQENRKMRTGSPAGNRMAHGELLIIDGGSDMADISNSTRQYENRVVIVYAG